MSEDKICFDNCVDHKNTIDKLNSLEKCIASLKKQYIKIGLKLSWLTGLTFFVGLILVYCLTTITGLNSVSREQAAKNQTIHDSAVQIRTLSKNQIKASITFTQIQDDLKYIKKDISEIKGILKKGNYK